MMLAGDTDATTVATGTGVTTRVAVPLRPSLVAVTVTLPTARVLTSPAASTVATAVLLDDQATVRPVRTFPAPSSVVAVACAGCPTMTLAGDTDATTVATGTGVTTRVAVPLRPSLVAVTVTFPAARVLTSPAASTVATAVLLDDQATVRPVRTFPAPSSVVAVACAGCPTMTLAGDTDATTVATGTGVTTRVAVPLRPSLVAVTVTFPAARVLTSPAASTVATAVLLDDQATVRPVRTFPAPSSVVAVACAGCPTMTLAGDTDATTDATGAGTEGGPGSPGMAVTVSSADPVFPSLDARMVAVPAATAVTVPATSMDATAGSLDDQTTNRPESTRPSCASRVARASVA